MNIPCDNLRLRFVMGTGCEASGVGHGDLVIFPAPGTFSFRCLGKYPISESLNIMKILLTPIRRRIKAAWVNGIDVSRGQM